MTQVKEKQDKEHTETDLIYVKHLRNYKRVYNRMHVTPTPN